MAADSDSLRVVYGQPTAHELAAVVAVLLRAARAQRGPAPDAASNEPALPGWLRGSYSAPNAWTAGQWMTGQWMTGQWT